MEQCAIGPDFVICDLVVLYTSTLCDGQPFLNQT